MHTPSAAEIQTEKIGILDFIEATEQYELGTAAYVGWANSVPTGNPFNMRGRSFEALGSSYEAINQAIARVGGLTLRLTLPNKLEDIVLATAWHGLDPKNADHHKWTVSTRHGVGSASMERSIIQEMRQFVMQGTVPR